MKLKLAKYLAILGSIFILNTTADATIKENQWVINANAGVAPTDFYQSGIDFNDIYKMPVTFGVGVGYGFAKNFEAFINFDVLYSKDKFSSKYASSNYNQYGFFGGARYYIPLNDKISTFFALKMGTVYQELKLKVLNYSFTGGRTVFAFGPQAGLDFQLGNNVSLKVMGEFISVLGEHIDVYNIPVTAGLTFRI
jgi:outer membrane protein with beta-barrel domain